MASATANGKQFPLPAFSTTRRPNAACSSATGTTAFFAVPDEPLFNARPAAPVDLPAVSPLAPRPTPLCSLPVAPPEPCVSALPRPPSFAPASTCCAEPGRPAREPALDREPAFAFAPGRTPRPSRRACSSTSGAPRRFHACAVSRATPVDFASKGRLFRYIRPDKALSGAATPRSLCASRRRLTAANINLSRIATTSAKLCALELYFRSLATSPDF